MRIFLGTTPAALRAALAAGSAGTAPVTAFAVTEALRASVDGDDGSGFGGAGAEAAGDDGRGDGGRGDDGPGDHSGGGAEADEELTLLAVEAAAWQSLQGLAAEHAAVEHAAVDTAAAGPAGSGTGGGGVDARRVVLAADVPDAVVTALAAPDPLAAGGGVRIATAVALDAVVSVLADGAGLAASVAAAVAVVAAGRTADDLDDLDDLGDGGRAADPALAALDEVLATPLLWYDAVELRQQFDPPRPVDRVEPGGAPDRLPAAPADHADQPRSST